MWWPTCELLVDPTWMLSLLIDQSSCRVSSVLRLFCYLLSFWSGSDLHALCYFFFHSPTSSVPTLLLVLLSRAHYRLCVCVGVFSSCPPHDIEFEVKVKGCYLAFFFKCFQAAYVCVFVPLVPAAEDQIWGHSWPERRPGGQLFPRSDTVFLWLLTIPSACWLPTSALWFVERASTPTTAWAHCCN